AARVRLFLSRVVTAKVFHIVLNEGPNEVRLDLPQAGGELCELCVEVLNDRRKLLFLKAHHLEVTELLAGIFRLPVRARLVAAPLVACLAAGRSLVSETLGRGKLYLLLKRLAVARRGANGDRERRGGGHTHQFVAELRNPLVLAAPTRDQAQNELSRVSA